jgi:endonuclease YncB( thermonuclease family)
MRRLLSLLVLLLLPVSSASAQLVTRVVDGDTIVVAGIGSVRLIGVDTPETVDPRKPVQFFGKEASQFTRRMAQGKVVRLEFDYQGTDKYQRTLAYVYLPDGTFLNAEIVKQGYGHAYVQYPLSTSISSAATNERDAKRGEGCGAERRMPPWCLPSALPKTVPIPTARGCDADWPAAAAARRAKPRGTRKSGSGSKRTATIPNPWPGFRV